MTYYSANCAAVCELTDCRVPFVPPVPMFFLWDSGTKREELHHINAVKLLRFRNLIPRIDAPGLKASNANLAVNNGIRNGESDFYLSFMNLSSGPSGRLNLAFCATTLAGGLWSKVMF